ncbi:MAG: Clp protease N-terminal domain-containing protein, partial [Candidatus Binatia bacterium]
MDLNRLTEKSQEALRTAQSLAQKRNHQGLDVEHLAFGVLGQTNGIAPGLLSAAGASP